MPTFVLLKKDIRESLMKIKYILSILLISSLPRTSMKAQDVVWFNGRQAVSYNLQKKVSPVVLTAMELFSQDMKAVTGHRAERKNNATIEIYQLDKSSNKEFKSLGQELVPIKNFIARKESFYIGSRGDKVIIAGSDGLGTAYGILELSQMAGVSPWEDITGIVPEKRKYLILKSGFQTIQTPGITHRGLSIVDQGQSIPDNKDYENTLKLLLRLKGDMIVTHDGHHRHLLTNKSFHNLAARYGISIEPLKSLKRPTILPLAYIQDPDHPLSLTKRQPGYVLEKLSQSEDKDAWVAAIHIPHAADYDISLFFHLAWNPDYTDASHLTDNYQQWLSGQFGNLLGGKLLPLMTEYYRLSGISKPEFQAKADFNSAEFGNELGRYIATWENLAKRLESEDYLVRPEDKKAYFSSIKYPVLASAYTTKMHLEAQEARNIARPGLFYQDTEALEAAANSMKAYEQILKLNDEYPDLPTVPTPSLPGKLTDKQIQKYYTEQDEELEPLAGELDHVVALNASSYTNTTYGTTNIPLLGHSNEVVKVPLNGELTYNFMNDNVSEDSGVVKIATIPEGSYSYSINIDGQVIRYVTTQPTVADKLRGQTVTTIPVYLPSGEHTLRLKALSPNVLFDQWMYDDDEDRIFYVFPVTY